MPQTRSDTKSLPAQLARWLGLDVGWGLVSAVAGAISLFKVAILVHRLPLFVRLVVLKGYRLIANCTYKFCCHGLRSLKLLSALRTSNGRASVDNLALQFAFSL